MITLSSNRVKAALSIDVRDTNARTAHRRACHYYLTDIQKKPENSLPKRIVKKTYRRHPTYFQAQLLNMPLHGPSQAYRLLHR